MPANFGISRCDPEHPAWPKGQPGEDEGLLGCGLLPRSEHPDQRAQKSHRGLGKAVPALTSDMVGLELGTVDHRLISQERLGSLTLLRGCICLLPGLWPPSWRRSSFTDSLPNCQR